MKYSKGKTEALLEECIAEGKLRQSCLNLYGLKDQNLEVWGCLLKEDRDRLDYPIYPDWPQVSEISDDLFEHFFEELEDNGDYIRSEFEKATTMNEFYSYIAGGLIQMRQTVWPQLSDSDYGYNPIMEGNLIHELYWSTTARVIQELFSRKFL